LNQDHANVITWSPENGALVVLLPDPFRGMGSRRNSTGPNQGRNQDFAKGEGGLKMEKFCDVILMT